MKKRANTTAFRIALCVAVGLVVLVSISVYLAHRTPSAPPAPQTARPTDSVRETSVDSEPGAALPEPPEGRNDNGAEKWDLWQHQYDTYRENHSQEETVAHMVEVIGADPDVESVVATPQVETIAVIFKPNRGYNVPIQTLNTP